MMKLTSVCSDAIHLSRVRDFVFLFQRSVFRTERADLAMAVDEACENATEHAHKSDRNKNISTPTTLKDFADGEKIVAKYF